MHQNRTEQCSTVCRAPFAEQTEDPGPLVDAAGSESNGQVCPDAIPKVRLLDHKKNANYWLKCRPIADREHDDMLLLGFACCIFFAKHARTDSPLYSQSCAHQLAAETEPLCRSRNIGPPGAGQQHDCRRACFIVKGRVGIRHRL
jgi:hypothetical protein